ncbi:MAG TPA: SDR family oxidoreductase, partial [Usitatibacter sp.]
MSGIAFSPASRLDGRVAVIAGGLGAIGRAAAKRFAALGARVGILHRRAQWEVDEFVATLPGAGHFGVTASITDSAALAAAAREVRERMGVLHVLVNTAGFTRPVPVADLEALDDALIDSIFASNWRGVFATIRAFHPLLKESGDGLIVNVSSISAFTGVGSNLAYVAAKAGLDVMGRSLARMM